MSVIGMEMLVGAGAVAGKEALKKAVESVYDAASDRAKKFLLGLKTERQISRLFAHISKVRKVKTLGQLDRAVDLTSFYCDSHVYVGKQRKKITRLSDFGIDENILIEGIAGQGKSIFLRYLCSVELVLGEYIPVFVELRKVSDKQSLLQHVIETLRGYRLDVTEEVLRDLADTGRLLLLLDAFDEIHDDDKARILHEIEQLSARHEKLRVIITSRPESGLAACPLFRVVRLSDLEGNEYATVIQRITDDAELSHRLISQVKKHKGGIQELLQTPLLVTLLVIRYKSYQELPEQLSDFYDSLFQVLLQRHDGMKPGYNRPRGCAINDAQYRQGFEALCFLSKGEKERQFSEATIHKIAQEALKERRINTDSQAFVSDIVKITCLLVKDGEEYRFIHKSVQEYYAACFISQKPDVVIKKLYPKLFSREMFWRFEQELRFLAEIDRYRFQKFGVLAYLTKMFSVKPEDFDIGPKTSHVAVIQKKLESLGVHLSSDRERFGGIEIPSFGPLTWLVQRPYEEWICDPIFRRQNAEEPASGSAREIPSEEMPLVKAAALNRDTWGGRIDIEKASLETAKLLFKIGRDAAAFAADEENLDAVLQLK